MPNLQHKFKIAWDLLIDDEVHQRVRHREDDDDRRRHAHRPLVMRGRSFFHDNLCRRRIRRPTCTGDEARRSSIEVSACRAPTTRITGITAPTSRSTASRHLPSVAVAHHLLFPTDVRRRAGAARSPATRTSTALNALTKSTARRARRFRSGSDRAAAVLPIRVGHQPNENLSE